MRILYIMSHNLIRVRFEAVVPDILLPVEQNSISYTYHEREYFRSKAIFIFILSYLYWLVLMLPCVFTELFYKWNNTRERVPLLEEIEYSYVTWFFKLSKISWGYICTLFPKFVMCTEWQRRQYKFWFVRVQLEQFYDNYFS